MDSGIINNSQLTAWPQRNAQKEKAKESATEFVNLSHETYGRAGQERRVTRY